jgi:hypothetical protein
VGSVTPASPIPKFARRELKGARKDTQNNLPIKGSQEFSEAIKQL